MHEDLARFRFKKPIYIATDQDETGDGVYERLAPLWPDPRRMRWEGGKDITEAVMRLPLDERCRAIERWVAQAV